jgi:hypothetical protein
MSFELSLPSSPSASPVKKKRKKTVKENKLPYKLSLRLNACLDVFIISPHGNLAFTHTVAKQIAFFRQHGLDDDPRVALEGATLCVTLRASARRPKRLAIMNPVPHF